MKAASWIVRLVFTVVFIVNVQCAASFLLWPEASAGAYELAGVSGAVAMRGMGIVFLMWNATYPAFIVAPTRFRVLGWVILAQQLIGLTGESLVLASLPAGHEVLAESVVKFITFDGGAFVLMAASFALLLVVTRRARRVNKRPLTV